MKVEIEIAHPHAAIFDEFPVCRKGRADLVAVNVAMSGFELKSDRDSLARLPLQVENYDCVFDFCTIVAAERHLKHVQRMVPTHWGLSVVHGTAGDWSIDELRMPENNPNLQFEHVIRILWKTEWIKTLRDRGVKVQTDSSVRKVWALLRDLPMSDVQESVRIALKNRRVNGSVLLQMSDGDLCTTAPIP